MQFAIEIFYDPFQLYDLEIYLNPLKYDILSQNSAIELSEYLGSKTLFVELNPGAYDIKIT